MKLGIQVSSALEWRSVKSILKIGKGKLHDQPFGKYFVFPMGSHEEIFYQSGATKTRATAACQFAIVTWHPDAIVNLGTCGGVSNKLKKRDIILVNKTVHYDCITQFGPIPKGFYKPMTKNSILHG